MVVVVIVGIASAAVVLTLRDRSQSKLEEEGARLSALLESARTQSRIVGTQVSWQPLTTGGFQFAGLPDLATKELPSRWLDSDTHATIVGAARLQLGPEPLLPAQRVVLQLNNHEIAVGTDGLAPFQIVEGTEAVTAQ